MAAIITNHKVGRARRRLYKPEREAPRAKAWTPEPGQTFTEAKLSLYEAELGIAAVMEDDYGVRVGRILGYDPIRNVFHCVGKRLADRKAVDIEIAGYRVSEAVVAARVIAGVPRLEREMSGR